MQISPKVKRQLRWQNTAFVILFLVVIGLVAWLSTRYVYESDWTASNRNSPSEAAIDTLKQLDGKVKVTAFVTGSNDGSRSEINHLIGGFRRFKSDIELIFMDPVVEPTLVRELGVTAEGELILEYKDRKENITSPTQQNIANALQRLARTGDRHVLFIEGHDERSLVGDAHYDYSNFAKQLKNKGFKVKSLNLAVDANIPSSTSAIVIADPQKDFLPGEIQIIQDYIDRGGNLLWMADPGALRKLEPVAEQIGVEFLPGTVVDMNTQLLGINDPRFAVVAQYPPNAIVAGLTVSTLFPAARGLEVGSGDEWEALPFLETSSRTWVEMDENSPDLVLDPGQDIAGPVMIGVTVTRNVPATEVDLTDTEKEVTANSDAPDEVLDEASASTTDRAQRIVVIGDADFISNAYLGQGGNLDLVMNIVNWLSSDDNFINLTAKANVDSQLQLSTAAQTIIALGILLVIPLGLLGAGVNIWWRRRKA